MQPLLSDFVAGVVFTAVFEVAAIIATPKYHPSYEPRIKREIGCL